MIFIYAPNAEGILNTVYSRKCNSSKGNTIVPVIPLGEPVCDSALIELKLCCDVLPLP
ncbi:MAG: hypothetical protein UH241_03515 [Acutalibacteraceae bacterium]|nr:hypothetical protein [Acutalibacteraceae bacterium]